MGEFTSAEDAIAELYDAMASDPYDDTQDALRDHLQDARDRVLSELTALRAENARLREALAAITEEFESTVRHCDNDGKGMHVPFHGDFAGAKQMPSIANRIRWWARFLRAALDAKEGET